MKPILHLLVATLGITTLAAHGLPAGPKGGKLFALGDQFVEFFVNPDREAEVAVLDPKRQPVAPGDLQLTVTVGSRSDQKKLDVRKTETGWRTETLPAGDGYFVILQIREGEVASPATFRIRYLEEVCSGCNLPEYACTCGH